MGTHDQNGRGVTGPGNGMRGPSWRPQDQRDARDDRDMRGRDEDYHQGQSGYGSGRQVDDRAHWSRGSVPERGFGTDERFTRREDEYWLDRGDRPNPQWDHRDRDFERHQRERMGYAGPRPSDRMQYDRTGDQNLQGNREARSWNPDEDRFDGVGMGDGARRGTHRGKGPLNYTRSDERIREAVCEALTDDHDVDASNIDVVVKNGEVTLSGTVEDRAQKRRAEDIAERCGGVRDVSNQLKLGSQNASQNAGNPPGMVGVGKNDKPRA